MKKTLTYISLFSSAGIGCFGFKINDFECIATNEILTKRLKIQSHNNKCKYTSGYIGGDITQENTKTQLFNEILFWQQRHGIDKPDVLIATPPCQGMSVANHKKNNEKSRNSLVVESIKITKEVLPKFFVFENVRAFLTTICTDTDGIDKPIEQAIETNLGEQYTILSKIVNFKDFGSNSSRTRTLVIGVRKDLSNITPFDIFPNKHKAKTLRELINDLPALQSMGEISTDIFHAYRNFDQRMLPWIEELKEGQSAFENTDRQRIPHRIVNGEVVYNKSNNGDKYARWYWDRTGPCVHTRNDILSSQNTVHPSDNRVFSIRELMRMMSVPNSFEWSSTNSKELNLLSNTAKKVFLKKEELNIRHCLGEAVPTGVFASIARNIKSSYKKEYISAVQLNELYDQFQLSKVENLNNYIRKNLQKHSVYNLFLITHFANIVQLEIDVELLNEQEAFLMVNDLPILKKKKKISIRCSVFNHGVLLPLLVAKYTDKQEVLIHVVCNNEQVVSIYRTLFSKLNIPVNFKIQIIDSSANLNNTMISYDIVL